MKIGFTPNNENMAKSLGVSLPISTRQSIEICRSLRGKKLDKAKAFLESVIEKKKAVPYARFNKDTGHKKGIGPGRYPIKACTHILKIIKSCEANAQFKGLNVNSLYLVHISAQPGAKQWHYGRQTRRKAKRTHIECVVEEKDK